MNHFLGMNPNIQQPESLNFKNRSGRNHMGGMNPGMQQPGMSGIQQPGMAPGMGGAPDVKFNSLFQIIIL